MKFTIVVHAPPCSGDPARTAFQFAESVLAQGHEVYRLFFFNDGVLNGLSVPDQPQALSAQWQRLITEHGIDAVLCVTSAQKRGLVAQPGREQTLPLAEGFTIGGLGQLVDGAVHGQRLITFGP